MCGKRVGRCVVWRNVVWRSGRLVSVGRLGLSGLVCGMCVWACVCACLCLRAAEVAEAAEAAEPA